MGVALSIVGATASHAARDPWGPGSVSPACTARHQTINTLKSAYTQHLIPHGLAHLPCPGPSLGCMDKGAGSSLSLVAGALQTGCHRKLLAGQAWVQDALQHSPFILKWPCDPLSPAAGPTIQKDWVVLALGTAKHVASGVWCTAHHALLVAPAHHSASKARAPGLGG